MAAAAAGVDARVELFAAHGADPLQSLASALGAHRGGSTPQDDITILLIEFTDEPPRPAVT